MTPGLPDKVLRIIAALAPVSDFWPGAQLMGASAERRPSLRPDAEMVQPWGGL